MREQKKLRRKKKHIKSIYGGNMNQNIYELMCEEWDGYEENWIIKMQSVGLVKQDLTEKERDQLWELITYGEY